MIIGIDINELGHPILSDGSWISMQGDKYDVTGVDVYGKRFSRRYNKWSWAQGVNLYRGSKWLVRGGRRYLIARVYN